MPKWISLGRTMDRPERYLYRIDRLRTSRWYRDRRPIPVGEDLVDLAKELMHTNDFEISLISPGNVADALAGLPQPQRQALALHHIIGFEIDKVASLLGMTEGRAKYALQSGRNALRGSPLLRPYPFSTRTEEVHQ